MARFAKAQESKMGKPTKEVKREKDFKSPISKGWISTFSFTGVWGMS